MSIKKLFYLIVVITLTSLGCKKVAAQNFKEEKVKAMLKDFYFAYTELNSKLPVNVKKYDSLIGIYCTKKALSQFEGDEGIEYDPYLKSQMVDTRILKTITFKRDLNRDNLYYVSYTYGKDNVVIKLLLVKENEHYKIDLVYKD